MKQFIGFLSGVFAAVIGGLLVVVFQGPIARQFSADRLTAEVRASPWTPFQSAPGNPQDVWEKKLGPYAAKQISEGGAIYSANWHIENRGAKKVENIRIDFISGAPALVYISQNGTNREIIDPKVLTIKEMSPGSVADFHIISVYDTTTKYNYMSDSIKT